MDRLVSDAVHIAIAALHEVQFIASWNFRHIVGAIARRNIELALTQFGAFVPVIAPLKRFWKG